MKYLLNIIFCAKNLLFPSSCALCAQSLINTREIKCGLCQKCSESFTLWEGCKCKICGKPLISEKDICISCRKEQINSYDRLWALFPYTGKYKQLLTKYKFEKNISIANFFAERVFEAISGSEELKNAIFVPVPPRPGKIKESGWDQVEILVKRLVSLGKVPVSRCLKRQKSRVQKELTRKERMENLKDRIYMQGTAPKIALVIDDVITTGSTMEVCTGVLKKAGAEKVYGLCLFYD